MPDLKAALGHLVPYAEALLVVNHKLAELEGLDEELAARNKALDAAEARMAKAEEYRVSAGQSVEKAKAEVIEARANTDKMVSSARQVAAKIIDDAKAKAAQEAEAIKASMTETIVMLTDKEAYARRALAQVEASLAARRADHDQVLASISSLKDRLGAA